MDNQQNQKHQRRIRSIITFTQGIAVTLLLLALTVIICVTVIYRTRVLPFINYAIVFDAGSSHTEMFVYRWPADKSDGVGTTSSVNEYFVCPLSSIIASDPSKPDESIKLKAISDFEQHLNLLDLYFRPCLQAAFSKIPSTRHKFSPIFLGATAGMRLARLRNSTRANHVLETIREIFANYPFQFVAARQVRILTGMEEAIDGWITTNILLEKFKNRHADRKHLTSPEKLDANMVGVLDLGGASTQVTFTYVHKPTDEPIPTEFTTNITLFDTVYSPYAHSYLCWGKNEALRRYRARLLNSAIDSNQRYTSLSASTLIEDPCFPRGSNETIKISNLFRSACTANEKQKFDSSLNISAVVFVGKGNAKLCRKQLTNLFDAKRVDRSVNCSYKKDYCTFDHTFQPKLPPNLHFIGLSGYYYVFHNLAHRLSKPIGGTTERYEVKDFNKTEFQQRLHAVCETHYITFYKEENMTANNEQHKRGLCFDAWYMWLLLTHAIGFKGNDLQRLSFANSFPTGKVGWTLGYMINQTNYIPAEYREKSLSKTTFISWVSVATGLAFVTLIFLLVTCQRYVRHAYTKRRHRIATPKKDGYAQPQDQTTA